MNLPPTHLCDLASQENMATWGLFPPLSPLVQLSDLQLAASAACRTTRTRRHIEHKQLRLDGHRHPHHRKAQDQALPQLIGQFVVLRPTPA